MSSREIVTLQFGHYSNFVGTGWWNIQETGFEYDSNAPSEIDHDVLYRAGITDKGVPTFTPRLLLVDLKGSLKTLAERSDLYGPQEEPTKDTACWIGDNIQINSNEPPKKNALLRAFDKGESLQNIDLDDEVQVWSDFLYGRYHPRSINIIKEYQHENTNTPFNAFPTGSDLWHRTEFSERFLDGIRIYMEECDRPQGFHIISDITNAFGGLAACCLENIRDEYEKKSILMFATIPSYYSDCDTEEPTAVFLEKLINIALTLDTAAEHCSLVVPLCTNKNAWKQVTSARNFNHLSYNFKSYYHTSNILASAADTLTLPYRVKGSPFGLSDFCNSLNTYGRKFAAASIQLPFPLGAKTDLIDCLDSWSSPLWQSVTPNCEIGTDKYMQIMTLRGIDGTRLKHEANHPIGLHQREMAAYRCETVKEMFELFLACNCFATATNVSILDKPMPTKVPYPNIFDESVSHFGNIAAEKRMKRVDSVPILSGCHSGPAVGEMLESFVEEAERIKAGRFPQFRNGGLESNTFKECLERLQDLRDCYRESFE